MNQRKEVGILRNTKRPLGSILILFGPFISLPGSLKTNGKLSEERAEDTDCDGSPLPEDFTEVRIMPR